MADGSADYATNARLWAGLQEPDEMLRGLALDQTCDQLEALAEAGNLAQDVLDTATRLAEECAFEDVSETMAGFVHYVKAFGMTQAKLPGPRPTSYFVPVDKVALVADAQAELRRTFEDTFVRFGRIGNIVGPLAQFHGYIRRLADTQYRLMVSDGPLPRPWRHYLAAMAAARHSCVYHVQRQVEEFAATGGDPAWLEASSGMDEALARELRRLDEEQEERRLRSVVRAHSCERFATQQQEWQQQQQQQQQQQGAAGQALEVSGEAAEEGAEQSVDAGPVRPAVQWPPEGSDINVPQDPEGATPDQLVRLPKEPSVPVSLPKALPWRIRALGNLNARLAHQPWGVTCAHISDLIRGVGEDSKERGACKGAPDGGDRSAGWSVNQLLHAIAILCFYHKLSSLALGLGLKPEVDASSGPSWSRMWRESREWVQAVAGSDGGVVDEELLRLQGSFAAQAYAPETEAPCNPRSPSSLVPPGILDYGEQEEDVVRRLRAEQATAAEAAAGQQGRGQAAEKPATVESVVATVAVPSDHGRADAPPPPLAPARAAGGGGRAGLLPKAERWEHEHSRPMLLVKGPLGRMDITSTATATARAACLRLAGPFSLQVRYIDYPRKWKHHNTQDFSWAHHGFPIIARFLPDAAGAIDAAFTHAYRFTMNTFGSAQGMDTTKYRHAIWFYTQQLHGIQADDFHSRDINSMLNRSTKGFVKKVACYPETLTRTDWKTLGKHIGDTDKTHAVMLIVESRMQSEMLHVLLAVSRYFAQGR